MTDPLNLANIRVLLAHGNQTTAKLYESMLRGFGVRTIHCVSNIGALSANFSAGHIDLAIIDNSIGKDDVAEIIAKVRREQTGTAREVPIVLSYGHSSYSDVLKYRDSGANMIMSSPFTADGVYDRLAWIARQPRPFVVATRYCGPCRRVDTSSSAAIQRRRHDDVGQSLLPEPGHASDELAIM